MADPMSATTLKEIIKDPLSYVIGIIIFVGGYLMKGTPVNATWLFGAALIVFGLICFLVKFIASFFEANFKRKYTQLIDTQASTIKNFNSIIKDMSQNTVAAHNNMTRPTPLAGGYSTIDDNVTSTGTGTTTTGT